MRILGAFRLLYLLGAINALFFSVLIFSKSNKTLADKILATWLVVLFAQLFIPFLYLTDLKVYYPYAGAEIIFYIFHPVLLYLYVTATIGRFPGRRFFIWNGVAVVLYELYALTFFFFPAQERLEFIEGKLFFPAVYIPIMLLIMGYFAYFLFKSYSLLKNFKDNILQVYSYRENVDLLWLRRLLVFFAAISFLVFPLGIISYFGFHSVVFADYFFFVTLVVFVFFLGFWGYQQGQIFSLNGQEEPVSGDATTDNLSDAENNTPATQHYKKEALLLQQLMKNNKPYLEPALTIHDLAGMAEMPTHKLSKVINKEFHCNFFEFVNQYRIEEFKIKAFSNGYKNLTILGIALECGFNSKSAFNRIFKEMTGLTPGDYIKNHKS
jgi:AraC-like DNA-binding protein